MESAQLILPVGASLAGRYEIAGVIGIGGMAVVYEAVQVPLGRRVAIKILNQRLAADGTFRRRFRREAEHAAALDHPNIVTIHDFGDSEGRPYLAMRLVAGRTLAEELASGAVTGARAIDVLEMLASALDHAHERGVLHRDVKPQNVLIDDEGNAYLADFGIAKGLGSASATVTGGIFGTIRYAAPEQIRGEPAGPAADTYALTGVAYELLASACPYFAESDARLLTAHLDDEPAALEGASSADAITRLLKRGLAKRPEDRPTSLVSFVGELRDAASSDSGFGERSPAFTRARRSAAPVAVDEWGTDLSAGATEDLPGDSAWIWAQQPRTVRVRPRQKPPARHLRPMALALAALALPAVAFASRPGSPDLREVRAGSASFAVAASSFQPGNPGFVWKSVLPTDTAIDGVDVGTGKGTAAISLAVTNAPAPMALPGRADSTLVRVSGGTVRRFDTGTKILAVAQSERGLVLMGCPYAGRTTSRRVCDGALTRLRMRDARLQGDPVPAVAATVATALEGAARSRRRPLPSGDRRLRRARAAATAAAYRRASELVSRSAEDRPYDGELASMVAALSNVGRGFSSLVGAAGHNSVSADRSARRAIERADRAVDASLADFARRGYRIQGQT